MIASTVWNQLVKTLEGGSPLKGYIKYVFNGRRYDIEPDTLPCIMLEPAQNNEILKEMNNYKEVALTVDIYAFSSNSFDNFDKTIVGDASYKGILDIENDIRAVLQNSYTLGDNVIDTRVEPTLFDQADIKQYPVRGLLMPVRVLYRQFNGV